MHGQIPSQALGYAMVGLVLAGTVVATGVVAPAPPATPSSAVEPISPGAAANTVERAPEATSSKAEQYWRRRRRRTPRYPDPNAQLDGSFVFARIQYTQVRQEYLGTGWTTDYPDGDRNFMRRLEEFTKARVSRSGDYPNHVVVTLYDEELFDYPFIFMSDVGTIGLDPLEVERLRDYLLRGGFLWVDDFWGVAAWDHWRREIGRVLPPDEYPILDIEADHPIRQMMYPIAEIPQIPSIQWWRRSGGYTTSERGFESEIPHLRGITGKSGRLMVLMSHDTDIADGWERENEDWSFFEQFSFPAYAVGINVALYAMSH